MALTNKMEATWEMSCTDFDGNEQSVRYMSISDEASERELMFGMEHAAKAIGMLVGLEGFDEYPRVMILPVNYAEYSAVKSFLDELREE